LAANIDRVFIVSSLNREFNPRRIERYVAAVHSSGAEPVLVLNKADAIDDPSPFLNKLDPALLSLRVIVTSAHSGKGIPELEELIQTGETVAFTGSSGVGKSSLLNRLMGKEVMPIADVRAVDDAGRHTTRNRTLLTFPSGGVLIDTPGMRELQLWTTAERITSAFGDIENAAEDCKFRNCGHAGEPGCAVQAEVDAGKISSARAASYRKLLDESTTTSNRRPGFSRR
jgi:ribosome biogenesis GTPase